MVIIFTNRPVLTQGAEKPYAGYTQNALCHWRLVNELVYKPGHCVRLTPNPSPIERGFKKRLSALH